MHSHGWRCAFFVYGARVGTGVKTRKNMKNGLLHAIPFLLFAMPYVRLPLAFFFFLPAEADAAPAPALP